VAAIFYAVAPIILLLWFAASVAFTLGLRTPVAGTILAAVMFGLVTADQQLYSNHSYLIAISVALLTACGAGSSLSLDARRRGTDADPAPGWTILALRTQVSIVYFFAVVAKLNPSFLSGSVIAASLRRDGISFPEAWIGFESMFVLSILVVASELFLGIALWRRRWRPAAFVIGLALHAGIVVVMHAAWDLAVFSVVTLSLYVAFLDAPRAGHAVVWDDDCGFCGTWVRWFKRLDWLDTLRFVPRSRLSASGLPVGEDAALEALHVVGPRRTTRAFRAVTDVLSVLPISFLWTPLLRVRPILVAGEKVYARVARSRTCRIPSPSRSIPPVEMRG
jgi:predicted DCC family thiol-disulfide oxidoreductase YuxK